MRRGFLATILLAFCLAWPARADDCQNVMAMLVAAQRDAELDMENIDALEAAIDAPSWDPVADGWMIDALGWALDDLIGDLNSAAIAEEAAHTAHCY